METDAALDADAALDFEPNRNAARHRNIEVLRITV